MTVLDLPRGSREPLLRRQMTLVLDAGALIAVERGARRVVALLKAELRATARQALLARLLAGVEIAALDDALGRRAGILQGVAGSDDVVDARSCRLPPRVI